MKLIGDHRRGHLVSVYQADALELMSTFREESIELVFMDPPFNIGEPYDSVVDSLSEDAYLTNLGAWIIQSAKIVKSTGSIWLNLPDRWAANAVLMAQKIGLILENWCIWHYRFAQCQPRRFLRSKTHALWFSKGNPYVETSFARVPSDRATIYADQRIGETENGGTRMDFDVWGFDRYWGRVQGNNAERGLTPNQLPEKYLERIIGTCSKEGDFVVDPFCGSGTTATVASAMNRRCITGDVSENYARAAFARVIEGSVRVGEHRG